MSGRLNQERESQLQPQRIESTKQKLEEMGFEIVPIDHTSYKFLYKGRWVIFFPYSGWPRIWPLSESVGGVT